jgi:hypothetical protein
MNMEVLEMLWNYLGLPSELTTYIFFATISKIKKGWRA